MNETNINKRPEETLEAYYKRIAKVADQRLVRLEALSQVEGYQGAAQWAYQRAMYDIEKWGYSKKRRFNTKPPADVNQLKAKINDIQAFLESPTSTKAGINAVYKKRAETFNANYGTNFKWQDFANFLSKYGDNFDRFDSDVYANAITVVRSMGKANPKLTGKQIQEMAEKEGKDYKRFQFVKSDGSDGQYDMHVDAVIHDLFTETSDVEELYRLLVGR